MKLFILKSLVLFYLFSSFVLATHVHIDGDEHVDDCQICVIVKAFSDIDAPKYDLNFSCELCSYFIETVMGSLAIELIYLKGFCSHAPPFYPFK